MKGEPGDGWRVRTRLSWAPSGLGGMQDGWPSADADRRRARGLVYFDVTNSLGSEESGYGGEARRLTALSGNAWYYYR